MKKMKLKVWDKFLFSVIPLGENLPEESGEIGRRGEENNKYPLECQSSVRKLVNQTEQRCCQEENLIFLKYPPVNKVPTTMYLYLFL